MNDPVIIRTLEEVAKVLRKRANLEGAVTQALKNLGLVDGQEDLSESQKLALQVLAVIQMLKASEN